MEERLRLPGIRYLVQRQVQVALVTTITDFREAPAAALGSA